MLTIIEFLMISTWLRGSSGGYTTVYSPTTSRTLRGLDPSVEYDVEVAAVDLCGRMSGFTEVASLDLQGIYNLTLRLIGFTYIQGYIRMYILYIYRNIYILTSEDTLDLKQRTRYPT